MFLFIAGIQPKIVDLEDRPRMCPSCGLYQARLKRTDQYVSLFFIPVFRIKTGIPLIRCERCGIVSDKDGVQTYEKQDTENFYHCASCGKSLATEFRFCPFCGKENRRRS